ncbi:glutaredoxin family protein [Oceaniserpentilla sp. 4NH20-0058]|uniref:glutaredoxin family protein n=1 Tax=Oceaniserpentilla sp. 4NH20-0058 TaxID=3127660 RepID=UPI00310A4EE1
MQIQLLGTSGCHLCEVAESIVKRIAPVFGYSTEYVDIANDDALVEQYGMRIPVLMFQQEQELGWPFDEQQLIHWLESLNKNK